MRPIPILFLLLATALFAPTAGAASFIWMEGEAPTRSNITVAPSGWGNTQFLSGGKWLNWSLPEADVEKSLPKDGALLEYDFTAADPGTYEVWDHMGFESQHHPFQWRIDAGDWHSIAGDELTVDLLRIEMWCEVSWLRMGSADLAAGKHTLQIRVPLTYRDEKGVRKPNAAGITIDALCLFKGQFRPHGPFKPDEDWKKDIDRKADQQVFTAAAPQPGGRAETSLAGIWQVARYDEQVIDDRTGPIKTMPAAAGSDWMGIAVPGDKNANRAELQMCHRFVYRTRLNVPAAQQGQSFYLHFPCNNMITTVFVNGIDCGFTRASVAAWDCDITKAVKPGQVNEIQVGIKDTYYSRPDDTRKNFIIPIEHWTATWTTEHLDFPIAYIPQSGMLLTPSLVTCGAAYTEDVFAIPSVKNKQLTLEETLNNPGPAEENVSVSNEIVPLAGGKAEKTFAPVKVTIPAGGTQVIRPSEGWETPKLWWPDDPQQYVAVTRVSINGRPVDVKRTKFGFREWEWAGPQLKLNGIPWHLRADISDGSVPEMKQRGQNTVRLWGSPQDVTGAQLDAMDASGMLVRRTGIFNGAGGAYGNFLGGAPSLFGHWNEQLAGWVKEERNHPSIYIWSIENEMTFINIRNWGYSKQLEPFVRKGGEVVMALDPTRPVMVDGGRALLDNSLPVYGGHYEETDQRDYPDEAYTLQRMLTRKDWAQPWPIDRTKPIFIGESFFARGNPPAWYAGVSGESAFLGRLDAARGVGIFSKMLSEGYRWSGVNYHFWLGGESDLYYNSWQPVALLCREWNWTFAGGTSVVRDLRVFNDTHSAAPITARWQLLIGGKPAGAGQKIFTAAPGGTEDWSISVPMPPVTVRTDASLVLTCLRNGKEVFRDTRAAAIINPNAAPLPHTSAADLLVLDPFGTVTARLRKRLVPFTPVARFEDLPEKAHVLIVGKDALTLRQATDPKWQSLAAGGARILVLDQKFPLRNLAVPADFDVTDDVGRIAFPENPGHPVFAGLASQDFFTWSKDHVVYRNVYKKASHGATSLVQCEPELACTALAACPVGDGLILASQLVVGEKLAFDPVAERLFDNMLNYCVTYAPVRRSTAVALPAATPEGKLLAASGLKFDTVTSVVDAIKDGKHQIVVADASPDNLKALVASAANVKAFTQHGGYLMLWGLSPAGLADFNTLVGVQHMIRPFEMERVTLPAVSDPLTAGITARDVVMESGEQMFGFAGDRFAASDAFTSVVDVSDVAPFSTLPEGTYWGYNDSKPGWDHWPRNMFNGFTFDDSWKYAFTINTSLSKTPTKWTMTFPQPQDVTELQILFTRIFAKVRKVNLYFDNDPTSVTFTVKEPWTGKQIFTLAAPRRARVVTVEIADYAKNPDGTATLGIDNMWLYTRRTAAAARVKPLLNIGGLVKYPEGQGAIVLNNLRVQENEPNPVNFQKKRTIVATLLRNMDAVFTGEKTVLSGSSLTYTPIDLSPKANAFLTKDKGWFDGRDLAVFPKGEQKLTGVTYLIRDFKTSPLPSSIMLAGPGAPAGLPTSVTGIPVNKKADALFFLHTSKVLQAWQPPQNGDATPPIVFKYIVHYADGTSVDVPVRYGQGVDNWTTPNPQGLKAAAVAWAAPFPNDTSGDQAVVYQFQWTNPKPAVEISSVDLAYDPTTNGAYGVPVLLALTAAAA